MLTGAIAYGFYKLIDSSIAYGEELRKASQITGIAADKLEKLRIGAGLAEVDVSTLSASLNIFSSNLANAQRGSKSDLDLFQRLGIDPKAIKSVDQGLEQVSLKFAEMGDGIKKTALAREIFGRGGAELIPLLNNYKDMLGEYTEVINAFSMSGAELKKFADDSDNIGDRFQIIGIVMKKLKIEFARGLYPAIEKVQKRFLKFLQENREQIYEGIAAAVRILSQVFEVFANVLGAVWEAGKRLAKDLKWIWENKTTNRIAQITLVFMAWKALPTIITAVASALRVLGTAFSLVGGWWGIAIIAVVAAVDDLIAYLNGEGSVIGAVAKWMEDPTFENLPEKFKTMFGKIKEASKGLLDDFREIPWVKKLREDTADFLYQNSPEAVTARVQNERLDNLIDFKENVLGMGSNFNVLGENDLASILNTGVIPVPKQTTNEYKIEQAFEINVETGADPIKISEEVGKTMKIEMDRTLRNAQQAIESGES